MLQVDKEVPFGDCIYCWLQMSPKWNLQTLVEYSSLYERPYLAWEEVRKGRNPYFLNGTGFEGYFVGICSSPDEALARILDMGKGMLTSSLRLHRFDQRYRSRLLKTLTGELDDPQAMVEWSTNFGATLARLHCQITRNSKVANFHEEISGIVRWLPPIAYSNSDHSVNQFYVVEDHCAASGPRILVNAATMKASEQEAWLVAQSIGKFGHPLVREFLRCGVNCNH